ncbi:MAG: trypsin-like serine protease [Planctomycetaceae bacterium]
MQLKADVEYAAGQQSNAMFGPLRAAVRPLPEAPDVEAIIGGETWKVIKNTKSIPYKAVCYIEATFPSGNTFIATGAFVGPRVVLTVAHACYDSSEGGFATTLQVFPGRNGSSSPYGSQVALFPAVPTLWTTTEEDNRDYDIAWIVLPDTTLHNKVKYYFGYKPTTDSDLRDAKLNMSGYPGTKGQKQYHEANKTAKQDVSAMQFKHYLDTVGGSSGSPMYLLPKGRQIVGVNCAEVIPGWPFNPYNIATRMTNDYYNITKQYNTSYH